MKKISVCRACGSRALTPVISAASIGSPKASDRDFGYVLCDPVQDARACGLVQSVYVDKSAHAAPSGRFASTRDHLRAVATEALEMISGRDCRALDIGANDGTLLSYYPRWVDRYGVEPAAVAESVGDWATVFRTRFPSAEIRDSARAEKFDIITAVSIFEHVDEPRVFLKEVKEILAADGVFVLETAYAPMALTQNAVEVFHRGVSAIYSLSVLEWLVRDTGLKIFKGALTEKAGGSVRLFICHAEFEGYDFDPWHERLARIWDEENALAMRAAQPYQSFERRIVELRRSISAKLVEIAANGETVHILGADRETEGLLEWLGEPSRIIRAAVDTTAARQRKTLQPFDVRIVSETECRSAEPDFIIAHASHKREALERWREAILLGARMMFLTPTPHIVTAANYAGEYGRSLAGAEGGVNTLRAILAVSGGPRLVADNSAQAEAS